MVKLVLVLGDQLTPSVAALRAADKATDLVVMAEVMGEASYVRHHPKKIALFLSAMRKFASALRADGWSVAYTDLDDPDNTGSISGELIRRADEAGAHEVLATRPGEWRLVEALQNLPLDVTMLEDDRFIARQSEFEEWAKGRKQFPCACAMWWSREGCTQTHVECKCASRWRLCGPSFTHRRSGVRAPPDPCRRSGM